MYNLANEAIRAINGGNNVVVSAMTGEGKTTRVVPLIARALSNSTGGRTLVVMPTRAHCYETCNAVSAMFGSALRADYTTGGTVAQSSFDPEVDIPFATGDRAFTILQRGSYSPDIVCFDEAHALSYTTSPLYPVCRHLSIVLLSRCWDRLSDP